MQVASTYTDDQRLLLDLTIAAADYLPELKVAIKQAGKNAQMPGFRKGMVPPALLRKLMGGKALEEIINKQISEGLNKYLSENAVMYLGRIKQTSMPEQLVHTQDVDYSFGFELGLLGNITLPDYTQAHLMAYQIVVNDADIDQEISALRQRHSTSTELEDGATITENDMLTISLTQLDADQQVLAEGAQHDEGMLMLSDIKDETTRQQLLGQVKGFSMVVPLFSLFEDVAPNTIARALLGIQQYNEQLNGMYQLTVTELKRITPAEMNPGFYEKVFPNLTLVSETDFRSAVADKLSADFEQVGKGQLIRQIDDYTLANTIFEFSEAWVRSEFDMEEQEQLSNPQNTEQRFEQYLKTTKISLAYSQYARQHKITASEEEITDYAYDQTMQQLQSWGISNDLSMDMFNRLVEQKIADPQFIGQAEQAVVTYKVKERIEQVATIQSEMVSADDFAKMHRAK